MSSGQEFILTAAMKRSGEKYEDNSTAENKLKHMVADLINFDLVELCQLSRSHLLIILIFFSL